MRRVELRTRTTTQRTTSPALTSPPGLAFLTLAMITSPSPAVRRLYREALPPRTLKHMTSLAPVLSATSSRVCIWIMGHATCSNRPPAVRPGGARDSVLEEGGHRHRRGRRRL